MKTLKNYLGDAWIEGRSDFQPLHDPCTEEEIARASSDGVDFGRALDHARSVGGPGLRALSFAERGELLMAMSKALHAHRDELIELSLRNTGTTRKDAKFDIDGMTGTFAYYAYLGKELGSRTVLADGAGVELGRSARFFGQHVRTPLLGVAVHVNAFNFPAWGFAEKAACSLLAGVPCLTKPATATALVTERSFEILSEAGLLGGTLPRGALSLLIGPTGDLLQQLGPQDAFAFTGSAATALGLRGLANLLLHSTRVNIEADSLNAAVLGPDVEEGSETWNLFCRDVEREITQKTGQKCTAVRRVFVPREKMDLVEQEFSARLERVRTGNPLDEKVTMGPLATEKQLRDTVAGIAKLSSSARLVFGRAERIDGAGNPAGKGYFVAPALLRADDARAAKVIHEHEVFGPCATLLAYDGRASEAGALVALAGGTLVTSIYSDDEAWTTEFVQASAAWTGRLYLGSEKMAEQAPGSGVALPQSLHGGPGRAGGGEELGGARGLELYLRRVALQGSRPLCERLAQGTSAAS